MKKNSNYMIFILLFYVIVAFMAFAFLKGDYSVFNRKVVTDKEAPMAETVVGNVEQTTQNVEEETVAEEEPAQETEPETVEEEPEEPEEEPVEEEPVVEEEPETTVEPEEEIVYYAFTTNHTKNTLRVRDSASTSGKILAKLRLNTKGYVLEYDENWCKVFVDNVEGYCSRAFLDLEEVDEQDFPEQYRDQVKTTKVEVLKGTAGEE